VLCAPVFRVATSKSVGEEDRRCWAVATGFTEKVPPLKVIDFMVLLVRRAIMGLSGLKKPALVLDKLIINK